MAIRANTSPASNEAVSEIGRLIQSTNDVTTARPSSTAAAPTATRATGSEPRPAQPSAKSPAVPAKATTIAKTRSRMLGGRGEASRDGRGPNRRMRSWPMFMVRSRRYP